MYGLLIGAIKPESKTKNMKHTTGPWIQQTGMIYREAGFKDNRFTAPSGLLLAQVMAHRDHGPALATAEANSRLIAAAPELLDALKEALANLEYLGLRDNKLPGMMQRINYAIAKAEGNA